MIDNYNEIIYEDEFLNISKIDNALVLKLFVENSLIISSWNNDGYQENMEYVVNQSLTQEDYPVIEDMSIKEFQIKRMAQLGLDSSKSTGLITSACMDNYGLSLKSYEDLSVLSIVTAGADHNGIKAGDPASFYEYKNDYKSVGGTINIITFINANLNPGALTTALITITEAKTSVLQDLKVESQFSTNIATGTGTDGVCVISNKSSDNHLENAGKHSVLGELIATSVYDATRRALFLETAMSAVHQSTVLSRLSRFNISFDDLYKQSDMNNINDYAILFNHVNEDKIILSYTSCVINLIDEVQTSLLSLEDIIKPMEIIFNSLLNEDNSYHFESIDDIINTYVDVLNHYIKKSE